MRSLLIDLDGVLYHGDAVIPGAVEVIAWLEAEGIPHLFVTNTTSRSRASLAGKLAGLGFTCREERILTPPVAACRWLAEHAPGPAALFVPESTRADFATVPALGDEATEGAASIVVGDLGEGWTYPLLNRAFRLLMAEPAPVLVALGMTRYWRAPDGLRLDVAPFVKALEHATGASAVVLGKPSGDFFAAALLTLGVDAGDAVMVGDDVVGDVQGAQRAGLRGVLVRTGKFRSRDLEGEIAPDAVLDSIASLPEWWPAGK